MELIGELGAIPLYEHLICIWQITEELQILATGIVLLRGASKVHYVCKTLRTAAEIKAVLLNIYCFSAFLAYISNIET